MRRRASGILLHITSLPSSFGIGDLGPEAYRFVDFLCDAHQSFWQILPLNPTSTIMGNSPYSSYSAFAGNPLLISPALLVEEGLLQHAELEPHSFLPHQRVGYSAVTEYKSRLLHAAYLRNQSRVVHDYEFEKFCRENSQWLDDYCLFIALKEHFKGVVWGDWPNEFKEREPSALSEWSEKLKERIAVEKFFQHLFFKQWTRLKKYCRKKNIQIIGDVPIYVCYDSSDVWSHPQLFKLDEEKRPSLVSGVPPDYFSATGQLWGNPVYDWDALKRTGYTWWIQRLEQNFRLFDIVRLDHFRGFVAYWEISASEQTAIKGKWVQAPVRDFLNTLLKHFTYLPIIAEDLGFITPDVREIINLFDLPSMRLLMFAFSQDEFNNPIAPHNYLRNCVVYTGTHDNNTVKGWFRREATDADRKRLSDYIGRPVDEASVHWDLVRLAMMSIADTAIIPMQDLLGLGEETRMNLPATPLGNWEWRLLPEQITPGLVKALAEITRVYGRA